MQTVSFLSSHLCEIEIGMKTEQEWRNDILALIIKITSRYPELLKYISELPVSKPEQDAEMTIKHLEQHYNSLQDILKKYALAHGSI